MDSSRGCIFPHKIIVANKSVVLQFKTLIFTINKPTAEDNLVFQMSKIFDEFV